MASLRTVTPRQVLPALLVALLFLLPGALPVRAAEGKQKLEKHFASLRSSLGQKNGQKAKVLSGPVAVKLLRGEAPGKAWQVSVGGIAFKVSIEDKVKMDVADCLARLEKVPPAYRRAFQIVSEGKKDGVAFYANLDGAAAHGSQDYLNMVPDADALVIVHEAGHILQQRATVSLPKTMDLWKAAVDKDKVSVSDYGDGATHEDLAEFAFVYALCLDAGQARLDELKALSPQRFLEWRVILEASKKGPDGK